MSPVKFYVLIFIHLDFTQSLNEIPPTEESNIVKCEAIIRNTFNSLFNNLKLKSTQKNTKFKEYLSIHKYFTSLALQDFDTLNQISRIVRVNTKNINKTADFMGIINKVITRSQIEENNEFRLINNNENVITYISYFLKNLKKLKRLNNVNKENLSINTNVLKVLKEHRNNSLNYKSSQNNINTNEYWELSGRRIFKGDRTKIKRFPFIASIQMFNNFHCAGSIIKSDLIITASSCLQLAWNNRLFRENPAFLSTRVGSSFYNAGGEVIPVLEIYFHPDYNPKNLRNNICMLRLARHLNFRRTRKIKKIDFDRQPSSIPVTTPGITILGWGAKQYSPVIGNIWKNILSFAVLHVYPLEDCQDVYSREYVTKKNFCAGFISRGGGACNRDVGGPGVADGKLMGIISFGSPVCGTPDAPTVFTKLGYYSDWIEEIMEMDVPVSKKRTTLTPLYEPFPDYPLYTTPKSTTFKISPIIGKMTPVPITLIDNQLRIFDDKVFKDFLSTMFESEEVDHPVYQLNNASDTIKTNINYETKYYDESTNSLRITKSDDGSTEDSYERHENTAVTLVNESQQNVSDIDENIENSIENLNLEKVKEKVNPIAVENTNESDIDGTRVEDSDRSKNETVLTLLYLSDHEKKGDVKIIPVHNSVLNDKRHEVLSIPVDFEDLTRAKDKVVRVLPKSDLFGLLAEVIGQEIPNID